jgi:hypothetical protein
VLVTLEPGLGSFSCTGLNGTLAVPSDGGIGPLKAVPVPVAVPNPVVLLLFVVEPKPAVPKPVLVVLPNPGCCLLPKRVLFPAKALELLAVPKFPNPAGAPDVAVLDPNRPPPVVVVVVVEVFPNAGRFWFPNKEAFWFVLVPNAGSD